MKRKPRIYYSDSQKALMWERWRQGDSMFSYSVIKPRVLHRARTKSSKT